MSEVRTKKEDLPSLFATQISLTEWLERINHGKRQELRDEDNTKPDRLRILNEIIKLPYDKPVTFSAQDIKQKTEELLAYVSGHGDELCALRLAPLKPGQPKLRIRGSTVRHAVEEWFLKQNIIPSDYRADFFVHPTQTNWSTVFVVNEHGIFGEIIADGHQHLTQGFYGDAKPHTFSFDFKEWSVMPYNDAAQAHIQEVVARIYVPDTNIQQQLQSTLDVSFHHNYLAGYFETVDSEFGTYFIDYNRLLGELLQDFRINQRENTSELSGSTGYPGVVQGRVRIVSDPVEVQLTGDEILVCDVTTPQHIRLMQQARAIVTDRGGVLSHASIIARELSKPCIVGTGNATTVLKDGDVVKVDADNGTIKVL